MPTSTPSDLLNFLHARALPKRLIRVGLALSSTIYSLRPDMLLAKSVSGTGAPEGGWLGESGPAPLELPVLPACSRGELFFIDAGVADPGAFWLAAPKGATVVCIPAGVDPWAFMAQEAERLQGLAAIHIVSHGAPGALVFNGRRYTAADLELRSAQLHELGRALTKNGDIFLYGCEVGAGREGQRLLDTLAAATGADIAASSDDTGSKARGGNWDLEVTTGPVDRALILDAKDLAGYDYVLNTASVNSVAQLKAAIATGNTDGSDDVITITGNITFASNTDTIAINVTDGHTMNIVGGGFTLSGNNLARVIDVTAGNVTINNLIITNGFVTGSGGNIGAGTTGSAGGDALGAGIRNAGTLTLTGCTITSNKAAGGGGGGSQTGGGGGAGGGGGGFGATFGGAGGTNPPASPGAASAGTGGRGAGYIYAGTNFWGGAGGGTTGGLGSNTTGGYSEGGNGGTANNGTISIGGGGGGAGYDFGGGRGGNAAGGISNTGTLTITGSSITGNIGAGGGGGGGAFNSPTSSGGNGGAGGSGIGGIWNAGGTVQIDSATNTSLSTGNTGGAGAGGQATKGGSSNGAAGTATSTISTTAGGTTTVGPNVTDAHISITSSGSGTGGVYKIGDTVTASWNNTAGGDNNSGITGVTMNFSQFGGGSAIVATNSSGTWTASYIIVSGAIDTTNRNVSVTATISTGSTTTADTTNLSVDDQPPIVTDAKISISGASGTGGAFKIGDTVTATWNNTAGGDNNADTISSVTVNFSQFGGGSAVSATNSSGTWTATYTIVSGAIDTTSRNVAVTATDNAGNTTTTADTTNATVDNIAPTVTDAKISISGASGSGGAYKIGDTVTATWNNTAGGDNNSDTISSVTVDFSQFGGGSAVSAANSSGTWTATYTIVSGVLNGTTNRNVAVTATDNAGNATTTADTTNATVDNVAPSITFSSLAFSADTGSSSTDFITNTAAQTITATLSGALAGGDIVSGSLDNGSTWTDITNKVSGTTLTWNGVTLTGSSTLKLKVTDAAGNDGTVKSQAYTLDTTAPAAPSTPDMTAGTDTGSSNSDNITNNTTPTFTGTAESGSTVTLYDTDGTTVLGTATATGGNWSITSSSLSSGSHTLTAKATDAAGNTSSASSGLSVTIDTAAPTGLGLSATTIATSNATSGSTISTLSATDSLSITYTLAVGNGTNDADNGSFTISGTSLEVGAASLTAGAYKIFIAATDAAGNIANQAFTITIVDAPSVSSIVRTGGASATVNTSATSISYTVTFSESVTGVDATDFTLTATGTASGHIASVSGSGTTYTVTVDTLTGDGTLRLDLNSSGTGIQNGSNVDIAGGYTLGSTYTLDHTAPAAPSTPDMTAGTDTGSSNSDNITANTTPTFTGTAESGSTVTLYDTDGTTVLGTATATGGNWSITSSALSEGGHTLTAKATDAAGNTSSASSGLSVTIDTTAPTVVSVSVPGNGVYKAGQNLDFTVNLSEAVIVDTTGGTPRIALTIGSTGVFAVYISGSGTSALVFRYTVSAGNNDTDGITVGALSANGGTIRDTAGNNTVLTLNSVGSTASVLVDTTAPTVTDAKISISGATGIGGAYKIGDTVTATWNNTAGGDNNSDIATVTVDFSQFGGGSAVSATNSSGTWTATYTIVPGSIDAINRNISVTATDNAGNTTTTADTTNATVDNIAPTVTDANISISGGTGGAYKVGDTVTATWNNTAGGDNNADTISGVTVDFSQFGGGSAVAATNSSGTWTATYTIVAGSINGSGKNVSVTATDNAGNTTTTADTTNATVNNAAPVVTLSSGSAAFVAGDNATSTPVVIDSGLTVTDSSSSTLVSGTVSITGSFVSGEDVLAFSNTNSTLYGNIAASYDSSTGVLTLTSSGATATVAQWQAALRAVTYTDTALTPNNATRTISFVVNDGTNSSATATRTLTVTATDQTPIVTNTGGITNYVAGTSAAVIDSGVTVNDLDNTTQSSATVSITTSFHGGDTLAFTNTSATLFGNIVGSYNSGTGVLTLTSSGATATDAQWANAFSAITFSAGSSAASGTRTISFVVNDGTKNSATGTKKLSVASVSASYPAPVPDGYAASATGGAGTGSVSVTVLTAANFRTQATSATPGVITVAGVIDLGATPVNVSSNKTIQGADANSALIGNLHLASGVSNVIIRGLNFTNPGTTIVSGAYTDGGDGVTIAGASNVFITHCTFFDTANYAVEITNGADNITVSWSEFYYTAGQTVHRYSLLIGTAGAETAPLHVTLHHNFWSTLVDQRMPIATFGYAHLYSNYFAPSGNTSGTVSSDQAQLLSERNAYTNTASPLTVQNVNTSLPIGRILALGNLYTATTGTAPYSGLDQVFTPSYSYEALPVTDVALVVSTSAGNIAGAGATDAAVGSASITGPSAAVTPETPFTLTAVPASFTPSSYQWRLGNLDIAGATSSTYTVSSTQAANAGIYTVAIGLVSGDVVVSTPFTVTLGAAPNNPPPNAPGIPGSSGASSRGGAVSWWFLGALALLSALRKIRSRRNAHP
ncbi:MAG TPA: Ig-like domain-containing protein [Opitutaceae bacterium]|jgi:pectate lyase|nr:Ig-like domain-containing protein [Opitutaceae bacterium]